MRRAVALALCLLLCAGAAEARTVYVSPVGDDSSTTFTSSAGTPLRTLDKAINSKANSGDTIKLGPSAGVHSSGRYADGIIPNRSWAPIQSVTVIGDSGRPNTTVVTSVNISGGSANNNYGKWAMVGVRVNGNVDVSESEGVNNVDVDGFVMRDCIVRNGLTFTDVDARLQNVVIGTGADTNSFARFISSAQPQELVLDSVFVNAISSPISSYGDGAIRFEATDTYANWIKLTATRCVFRVYGLSGWVSDKPTFFRGWNDCTVTDTRFEIIDSTGNNNLAQGLLWRDNLERNTFCRDTFNVTTVRAGTGAAVIRMTSSGSSQSFNAGGNNVWRYCWFTSNIPTIYSTTGGTLGFTWQIQPGDSFYYNVVRCSTGTTRAGFVINNVLGSCYVGNNTFFNKGTGGVLMVNDDGTDCAFMTGALKLENNIFYSQSTGTTSADYAVAAMWRQGGSRTADFYDSDYNLFAHYGSTSGARSLYAAPCGSMLALHSPSTMYALHGVDRNSLHGSPMFTDSSFATFNPTLTATSYAKCSGRGGATIGAIDADCVRPEAIEDLNAGASGPTAVAISWTAVGDDSLTGSGATYDIRYSTALIDESTWSSATQVTGESTPSQAGSYEMKVVTGLAAATLYYFAIKVSDEYGNESAVSNCASRQTPVSGPDIAEP